MSGNLCRCAAYPNIVAAVKQAKAADARRLSDAALRLSSVPTTPPSAVQAARRGSAPRPGAGAIPRRRHHADRPDEARCDAARTVWSTSTRSRARRSAGSSATPSGLRLGALVRMAEAAEHPDDQRDYPVIAQSLKLAASQQIRNMASLGGNVLQRTRCPYFRDVSLRRLQQAQSGLRLRGAGRLQPQARGARRQRPVHRDLSGRFRPGADRARRHGRDRRAERRAQHRRSRRCIAQPGDTPDIETTLAAGRDDHRLSSFRRRRGRAVRSI